MGKVTLNQSINRPGRGRGRAALTLGAGLLATAAAIPALWAWVVLESRVLVLAEGARAARQVAVAAGDSVGHSLAAVDVVLQSAAEAAAAPGPAGLEQALRERADMQPSILGLAVVDGKGRAVASARGHQGVSAAVAVAVAAGPRHAATLHAEGGALVAARRVNDVHGAPAGAVVAWLDAGALLGSLPAMAALPAFQVALCLPGGRHLGGPGGCSGGERASTTLGRLEVVVGANPEGLLASWRREAARGGLVAGLATLLVAALGWALWRQVAEALDARARADAASRATSAFLATMSHELRTPLNAVIGFAGLLKGPAGEARRTEWAADIEAAGQHLLGLINDLLDMAKLEAGALSVRKEPCDLAATARAAARMQEAAAARGGVHLVLDLPSGPAVAAADPVRLRQALLNLLSNAVKFTPAGGTATVSLGGLPGGGWLLAVEDTGIGMAENELPLALEPFGQVANALTRAHEGTGLGLPITKRLVELHGWRFHLTSSPGVGTRAEVHVPGTAG